MKAKGSSWVELESDSKWQSLSPDLGGQVFNRLLDSDVAAARQTCRLWAHTVAAERAHLSPQSLPAGWTQAFPRIRSISLESVSRKKIVDDSSIQELWKLRELTSINLQFCFKIGDAGMYVLSSVTSLRELDVHCCSRISNEGVAHLATLPRLSNLNLAFCHKITDAGVSSLSSTHTLQDLDLSGLHRITAASLEALPSAIRRLNLSGCPQAVDDDGVRALTRLSSLQHLSCSNCRTFSLDMLSRALSRHITPAVAPLKSVVVTDCPMLDDPSLRTLAALPCLQRLNVSGCDGVGSSDDAATSSPLSALTQLTHLRLDRCTGLQDDYLNPVTRFRNLKCLSLEGCTGISSHGHHFVGSCPGPVLKLRVGPVNDMGVEYICHLSKLQQLELSGACQLSDAGLQAVHKLSSLERLSITVENQEPGLTEQGLFHLRKLMPQITIDIHRPAVTAT